MRRRATAGFTLVEALIALGVLAIVLAIAYGAISQGLRVQSGQEAATATQARLRRITEVFTQEIRSAVLGAVSNTPYTSGNSAVSFMLLDGGAGFQVTAISGSSNNIRVVASDAEIGPKNTQVMLVDAGGQAVLFNVGSNTDGSGGTRLVTPTGSSCFTGLAATASGANRNALLFRVKTLGLSYDGTDTLYQRERNGAAQALAFNLSGVNITYVYEGKDTKKLYSLTTPLLDGGLPSRNGVHGGEPVELLRLQLELSSEGHSLGGTVERSYVSQVELGSNPSFSIRAVKSCV